MDELKAWLQQKLGERLYKKLSEENINALHQAGYDNDSLSLVSRESLKELQFPLAIVDILLAKCGAAAGPGSQSTGAGASAADLGVGNATGAGRGGGADVGGFGPIVIGTSFPTNSDEMSTRYNVKTPLLVKIIREHWGWQGLEKRKTN